MSQVKFFRGSDSTNLPSTINDGALYVVQNETDTGDIYVDINGSTRLKISPTDRIETKTNAEWTALENTTSEAKKIYFYTDTTSQEIISLKVGDGITTLKNLPTFKIVNSTNESFWNNKATAYLSAITPNVDYKLILSHEDAENVILPQPEVDTLVYPSAFCDSSAATASKTAKCTGYTLTANTWVHVLLKNPNNAAAALTLNINNTGAKPIYINGVASSASNYGLAAGTYIVFYNGSNYYFRTDGYLTPPITVGSASNWSAGSVTTISYSSANNKMVITNGRSPQLTLENKIVASKSAV